MFNVQVVIDPDWPIDRLVHLKRRALHQLLINISELLLDDTHIVTIISSIKPSNIYPGLNEYTVTAEVK